MISSREVAYVVGDTLCRGTLFFSGAAPRPGVVVFPEFWGINDYSRRRARMLAELGYTALAADVYGEGRSTDSAPEANAWMGGLMRDPAVAGARIRGAVQALAAQAETVEGHLGAIGYCMGGALALAGARLGLPLRAVASFHGILDSKLKMAAGGTHPRILICHGGADPIVSPESIAAFHQEMKDAGVDYSFVNYPGVLHAFTNPLADERARRFGIPLGYDANADQDSWERLVGLLAGALG